MTDDIPDYMPDTVTISLRVENHLGGRPYVPGSEKHPCESCGEDVYISPATQEEIESGVYPEFIICVQCVTGHEPEDE